MKFSFYSLFLVLVGCIMFQYISMKCYAMIVLLMHLFYLMNSKGEKKLKIEKLIKLD